MWQLWHMQNRIYAPRQEVGWRLWQTKRYWLRRKLIGLEVVLDCCTSRIRWFVPYDRILGEFSQNHIIVQRITKKKFHDIEHLLLCFVMFVISANFLSHLKSSYSKDFLLVRPRQKSKTPLKPYKSSQDHARPLILLLETPCSSVCPFVRWFVTFFTPI